MKRFQKIENYTVNEYIDFYFQQRKDFIHRKEREADVPLTTSEKFKNRVIAKMKNDKMAMTVTNAKKASQSLLRTRLYKSYAELEHENLTKTLKKEGMTSRLYRMGGKTAFSSMQWVGGSSEKTIDNKTYKSKGFYKTGDVKIIFWTSVDGSRESYIEFINETTGKSHLQLRRYSE